MKKFPANVPRKMFWSSRVDGKSICPDCGTVLINEYHIYVMAIRKLGQIDPYLVGNTGGYFCERCPVVVLDNEAFDKSANMLIKGNDVAQCTVLGLVDLEAIPKENSDLPLGGDGNPIPLVEFSNLRASTDNKGSFSKSPSKRRTVKKKKKKKSS
jgi:hypothetical protein